MRRSTRSAVRLLVGLLLVFAVGGCTVISDEFVWLDKAAPDAHPRGAAGMHGIESRP